MSNKVQLSFWQIIHLNVGFFGIQYSFGLQQSAVNPIYDFLGASPDQIPILNLAGPITGLIVQPIVGAISDRTFHPKWGRRKPFFLLGAILCSIALFFFPFSSSLWFATGMLWILDIGNNMAMEPYRAYVADTLDEDKQSTGFLIQSFFTGFGQTIANLSLFIFPLIFLSKTGHIPNWVFASFFLGSICSIASILWSLYKTKEIKELPYETSNNEFKLSTLVHDFYLAFKEMPRSMKYLSIIYLFQWYALFCYWQNSSKAIAINCFEWKSMSGEQSKEAMAYAELETVVAQIPEAKSMDTDSLFMSFSESSTLLKDKIENEKIQLAQSYVANRLKYEKAVSWTGLVNGWYNIVTFIVALVLIYFAKIIHPKFIHATALFCAAVGLFAFSQITNKYWLFVAISGFGIAWASIMAIPFLLVVKDIPAKRYGIYMGIINAMIVIPMFIQTTSFGFIMRNYLNNNSATAIVFAAALLLISSFLCLFFPTMQKNTSTT